MKTTWRLSKHGKIIGYYNSESEAIETREVLCGINQRDDFFILEMRRNQDALDGLDEAKRIVREASPQT